MVRKYKKTKKRTRKSLKVTYQESFTVLVFEFLGTALLTCLIVNYYNEVLLNHNPNRTDLFLGVFMVIMFSYQISGSHFNPCITVGFMIGKLQFQAFDRALGMLYIAAQFLGALTGGVFATLFGSGENEGKTPLYVSDNAVWQQIVLESMASFFLVFMYLISVDKTKRFTEDQVI